MTAERWNPTPSTWRSLEPLKPKPRILLFEFDHACAHYRCELLDHGELGVEAQFTRKNGEWLEGRTFETTTLAPLWAQETRHALELRI